MTYDIRGLNSTIPQGTLLNPNGDPVVLAESVRGSVLVLSTTQRETLTGSVAGTSPTDITIDAGTDTARVISTKILQEGGLIWDSQENQFYVIEAITTETTDLTYNVTSVTTNVLSAQSATNSHIFSQGSTATGSPSDPLPEPPADTTDPVYLNIVPSAGDLFVIYSTTTPTNVRMYYYDGANTWVPLPFASVIVDGTTISQDAGTGAISVTDEGIDSGQLADGAVIGRTVDFAIGDINDVDTSTTPAMDQALKWNGTHWAPANDADTTYEGSAHITVDTTGSAPHPISWSASIDSLTDVDTTTNAPTNEQVLVWNGTHWVPANNDHLTLTDGAHVTVNAAENNRLDWTAELSSLSNVGNASPSIGQALKWNGTVWAPDDDENRQYMGMNGIDVDNAADEITLTAAISNLSDVNTTGRTDGQILHWQTDEFVVRAAPIDNIQPRWDVPSTDDQAIINRPNVIPIVTGADLPPNADDYPDGVIYYEGTFYAWDGTMWNATSVSDLDSVAQAGAGIEFVDSTVTGEAPFINVNLADTDSGLLLDTNNELTLQADLGRLEDVNAENAEEGNIIRYTSGVWDSVAPPEPVELFNTAPYYNEGTFVYGNDQGGAGLYRARDNQEVGFIGEGSGLKFSGRVGPDSIDGTGFPVGGELSTANSVVASRGFTAGTAVQLLVVTNETTGEARLPSLTEDVNGLIFDSLSTRNDFITNVGSQRFFFVDANGKVLQGLNDTGYTIVSPPGPNIDVVSDNTDLADRGIIFSPSVSLDLMYEDTDFVNTIDGADLTTPVTLGALGTSAANKIELVDPDNNELFVDWSAVNMDNSTGDRIATGSNTWVIDFNPGDGPSVTAGTVYGFDVSTTNPFPDATTPAVLARFVRNFGISSLNRHEFEVIHGRDVVEANMTEVNDANPLLQRIFSNDTSPGDFTSQLSPGDILIDSAGTGAVPTQLTVDSFRYVPPNGTTAGFTEVFAIADLAANTFNETDSVHISQARGEAGVGALFPTAFRFESGSDISQGGKVYNDSGLNLVLDESILVEMEINVLQTTDFDRMFTLVTLDEDFTTQGASPIWPLTISANSSGQSLWAAPGIRTVYFQPNRTLAGQVWPAGSYLNFGLNAAQAPGDSFEYEVLRISFPMRPGGPIESESAWMNASDQFGLTNDNTVFCVSALTPSTTNILRVDVEDGESVGTLEFFGDVSDEFSVGDILWPISTFAVSTASVSVQDIRTDATFTYIDIRGVIPGEAISSTWANGFPAYILNFPFFTDDGRGPVVDDDRWQLIGADPRTSRVFDRLTPYQEGSIVVESEVAGAPIYRALARVGPDFTAGSGITFGSLGDTSDAMNIQGIVAPAATTDNGVFTWPIDNPETPIETSIPGTRQSDFVYVPARTSTVDVTRPADATSLVSEHNQVAGSIFNNSGIDLTFLAATVLIRIDIEALPLDVNMVAQPVSLIPRITLLKEDGTEVDQILFGRAVTYDTLGVQETLLTTPNFSSSANVGEAWTAGDAIRISLVASDEISGTDTPYTTPLSDGFEYRIAAVGFDVSGNNFITNLPSAIDDTSTWQAVSSAGSGGGASFINDLGDVDLEKVDPLQANQVLRYDGSDWINGLVTANDIGSGAVTNTKIGPGAVDGDQINFNIDSIGDVDTSTTLPTTNQVLSWNGTNWIPADATPPAPMYDGVGEITVNNVTDQISWQAGIDALTDVDTATVAPTNTQVLAWNGTNWVPADASSGGGATDLNGLSDVDTTGETSGQFLGFDGAEWSPTDLPPAPAIGIDNLTDVDTTTDAPTSDQVLTWNGSEWAPADLPPDPTLAIDNLSDVDTTTTAPTADQVLAWDGTNWVPADSSSTTLQSLTDTDIDNSALTNGQLLHYNTSSSDWEPVDPGFNVSSISGLVDVDINETGLWIDEDIMGVISYDQYISSQNLWVVQFASAGDKEDLVLHATYGFNRSLTLTNDIPEVRATLTGQDDTTWTFEVKAGAGLVNSNQQSAGRSSLLDRYWALDTDDQVQHNQVLVWNTGGYTGRQANHWVAADIPRSIEDLSDTPTTTAGDNQILTYNGVGTNQGWVYSDIAPVRTTFASLSDVRVHESAGDWTSTALDNITSDSFTYNQNEWAVNFAAVADIPTGDDAFVVNQLYGFDTATPLPTAGPAVRAVFLRQELNVLYFQVKSGFADVLSQERALPVGGQSNLLQRYWINDEQVADGDVIVWNATDSLWESSTRPPENITTLSALHDVAVHESHDDWSATDLPDVNGDEVLRGTNRWFIGIIEQLINQPTFTAGVAYGFDTFDPTMAFPAGRDPEVIATFISSNDLGNNHYQYEFEVKEGLGIVQTNTTNPGISPLLHRYLTNDVILAGGEVLTWNVTDSKWEALAPTGGGTGTIDDLGDIGDVTAPTDASDGLVLRRVGDADTGTWEPSAETTYDLGELDDVSDTTAVDLEILRWINADSRWEPSQERAYTGSNGITVTSSTTALTADVAFTANIDNLGDVDTSTTAPTEGQVLTWDNTNSQWEPASPASAPDLDGLGDVDTTNITAAAGQVLGWNNTSGSEGWERQNNTIGNLQNVAIPDAGATDDQVLFYDDSDDTWKPQSLPAQVTTLWGLTDVDVLSGSSEWEDHDITGITGDTVTASGEWHVFVTTGEAWLDDLVVNEVYGFDTEDSIDDGEDPEVIVTLTHIDPGLSNWTLTFQFTRGLNAVRAAHQTFVPPVSTYLARYWTNDVTRVSGESIVWDEGNNHWVLGNVTDYLGYSPTSLIHRPRIVDVTGANLGVTGEDTTLFEGIVSFYRAGRGVIRVRAVIWPRDGTMVLLRYLQTDISFETYTASEWEISAFFDGSRTHGWTSGLTVTPGDFTHNLFVMEHAI